MVWYGDVDTMERNWDRGGRFTSSTLEVCYELNESNFQIQLLSINTLEV